MCSLWGKSNYLYSASYLLWIASVVWGKQPQACTESDKRPCGLNRERVSRLWAIWSSFTDSLARMECNALLHNQSSERWWRNEYGTGMNEYTNWNAKTAAGTAAVVVTPRRSSNGKKARRVAWWWCRRRQPWRSETQWFLWMCINISAHC